MNTAGNLDCRFYWEWIDDECALYDRRLGAGRYGENRVAVASDTDTAERLCGLLNAGDKIEAMLRTEKARP